MTITTYYDYNSLTLEMPDSDSDPASPISYMENCMRQQIYLAPMEGVTGYIYRNVHRNHFKKADCYMTPFIATNQKGILKTRDQDEILPEHNRGICLVPQILSNSAPDFLKLANRLQEAYGYREVNLNLGCPSRTVVTKKKGSGFLAYPEELDRFLDEIYSGTDMKISIKTRIGWEKPEEFYGLIRIYNRYPLSELVIHPRVQKDFYGNVPNMGVFLDGLADCNCPVCYNGDIFNSGCLRDFMKQYPQVKKIMIGRGLIANPGLVDELDDRWETDKKCYYGFVREIGEAYCERMSGERNALFKLKELWGYMIRIFSDPEKYWKKIRKSKSLSEYETAVDQLFEEQEIIRGAGFINN